MAGNHSAEPSLPAGTEETATDTVDDSQSSQGDPVWAIYSHPFQPSLCPSHLCPNLVYSNHCFSNGFDAFNTVWNTGWNTGFYPLPYPCYSGLSILVLPSSTRAGVSYWL